MNEISLITFDGLEKISFDEFENFWCSDMQHEGIILKNSKISLMHHRKAFFGCFSLFRKKDINWFEFKRWKDTPSQKVTAEIGNLMIPFITNHYDMIVTAPPSKNRDWGHYCCFKLCEYIAVRTVIPFVRAFQQRKYKTRHGIYESLRQEDPGLLSDFEYHNKSILFIDDFITSTTTARKSFEKLRAMDNHIDGLIFAFYG
jgi:predicted amidophosphoribosyltransferase